MSSDPVRASPRLKLTIFHTLIEVHCAPLRAAQIISTVYQHFLCPSQECATLQYRITAAKCAHGEQFSLYRDAQLIIATAVESDLLYYFEKDLTIALQRCQPRYFYLHAAVLEKQRQLIVLGGESGAGKSTTSWALLHHGFHYLSDELAPIDVQALAILPYPHAICLKQPPPTPYTLPATTLRLEKTWHVPVTQQQGWVADDARLSCFIFIHHRSGIKNPTLQRLSPAEATVHIYKNALNQLAHPNDGLHTALILAQKVPAYQLAFERIEDALQLVQQALAQEQRILVSPGAQRSAVP